MSVKGNRTKVKVKKWIDTPDLKRYEAYISRWHYFLKDIRMAETEAAQNFGRTMHRNVGGTGDTGRKTVPLRQPGAKNGAIC